MTEPDETVQKVLEVRKVGADYEEHQQAAPLDIPVDLHNFKKFPVVDPPGMHKPTGPDTRAQIRVDSSAELPDYSGPFKADLRFSDFSNQALVNMIAMSDEYYRVCVEGWADEVAKRYGDDLMREIQAEAWQTIVLPQLPQMLEEWMEIPADRAEALVAEVADEIAARKQADGGVVTINSFRAEPISVDYPKEKLVKWALGSHEYLLTAIEGWAGDIVIRYGLDAMFAIQWDLWSERVLPAVRDLKGAMDEGRRRHGRGLHERHPGRRLVLPRQGLRADVRDAGARRRHHDVQQVHLGRPVGVDGTP